MESCVGAGDIMGVAVPEAAPMEYGEAPAAALHSRNRHNVPKQNDSLLNF